MSEIYNVTFVNSITGDVKTLTLHADDELHARERALVLAPTHGVLNGSEISAVHPSKPPEEGDPEPL